MNKKMTGTEIFQQRYGSDLAKYFDEDIMKATQEAERQKEQQEKLEELHYDCMKRRCKDELENVFYGLENEIRSKYKSSNGFEEFSDYKNIAHKIVAECVNTWYSPETLQQHAQKLEYERIRV